MVKLESWDLDYATIILYFPNMQVCEDFKQSVYDMGYIIPWNDPEEKDDFPDMSERAREIVAAGLSGRQRAAMCIQGLRFLHHRTAGINLSNYGLSPYDPTE